jgi:CubicO group peptidase (beta-lactamase class C family)
VSLEVARQTPPDGAPGERLNYSNVGYSVLGRVIEKVTGRTYEDYIREAILAPRGMADTGVERRAPLGKGRACGYLSQARGRLPVGSARGPGRSLPEPIWLHPAKAV